MKTTLTLSELYGRGYDFRCRVADERAPNRLGTITDVISERMICVRWDDGELAYVSWLDITPTGYRDARSRI